MKTAVEWTPENGERVWVKVFSNWSLGTYIGFDTIENKHLVREDADGGGHLMASSQVLPECANPNVPKQLTPVEWFANRISHGGLVSKKQFNELLNQAKEMEKEKAIDFARHCLNKAKDLDILTSFMNVEKYYNETFKSE